MRIAIVLERFEPQRGGLEQWAWQFVQWLSTRKQEIHVIASSFGPGADGLSIQKHVVELMPGRLDRAAEFERVLRGLPVDIIHDLGSGYYFDIFHPHFGSRIVGFRRNLQALPWPDRIRTVFSSDWRRRYRELRALERIQYCNKEGVVIAVSQMVRRHLEDLHGVGRDRIEVIYNGVNLERFSPAHRAEHRETIRAKLGLKDEILFLLVAHNFALKGVNTALEAMRRLKLAGRDAHLAVVGRGRLGEYRELTRRLEIDQCVTFCGPAEAIEPYFAAADAYVHPTYYDPCSLTVLEALASGLPVITTKFNGVTELMTSGVNGFVVADPRDAKQIAARMEMLFDEKLRSEIGRASRILAQAHAFENSFESILSLYEREAQRKRAKEPANGSS